MVDLSVGSLPIVIIYFVPAILGEWGGSDRYFSILVESIRDCRGTQLLDQEISSVKIEDERIGNR